MNPSVRPSIALLLISVVLPSGGRAQESHRLREDFPVGYRYHVKTRVELSGSLTVPAEKDKKPMTLTLRGESVIEYHERVLSLNREGQVRKTLRLCRQTDVRRTVGGRKQEQSLRDAVRRLVLLRQDNTEVPFSPDGPLTWGELDLIRTDVFTPALAGLLPDRAVRTGDGWKANGEAMRELTDMDEIASGVLECKLEQVTTIEGRRHARVSFRGTLEGTNEDGPNRQKLEGYYFFDLVSQHLSYLYLRGAHVLLDKDGKEMGRIEGRFILTRQVKRDIRELDDAALRGLTLEPDDRTTRLLYTNASLGLELVHPRRWRVVGVRGAQVILDDGAGMGLLITRAEPARAPSGARFRAETLEFLGKEKARVTRTSRPHTVRARPPLENFWIEAEMKGQKVLLDYHVTRQTEGGATVAVRLPLPATRTEATDRALAEVRGEIAHLAESIRVLRPAK